MARQWAAPFLAAAHLPHPPSSLPLTRVPRSYVFNNEESDRSGMSSNVPDRAAKELYYKPFAAAVDAGVGSAMCSYVRGCCVAAAAAAATLNTPLSPASLLPAEPREWHLGVRGRELPQRDPQHYG